MFRFLARLTIPFPSRKPRNIFCTLWICSRAAFSDTAAQTRSVKKFFPRQKNFFLLWYVLYSISFPSRELEHILYPLNMLLLRHGTSSPHMKNYGTLSVSYSTASLSPHFLYHSPLHLPVAAFDNKLWQDLWQNHGQIKTLPIMLIQCSH